MAGIGSGDDGVVVLAAVEAVVADRKDPVALGQEVVHQFLLDRHQLPRAAPEGGSVTDLFVAGVEVAQHQVDRVELGVVSTAWR